MTVQTTEAWVIYDGDGVTTAFDFTFPVFNAEWMQAFVDRQPVAIDRVELNTDQAATPGGTVYTADAPYDGATVHIVRVVPFDQLTAYPEFSKFPARDHEEALDKLTMLCQTLGWALYLIEGDGVNLYVKKTGDNMLGTLTVIDPVGGTDAAHKGYVDTTVTDAIAGIGIEGYVQKAGDTMTGPLVTITPTAATHAANKGYVDGQVAAIGIEGYVKKTGDTMSGNLTIEPDPTTPTHATNKQYVDALAGTKADKSTRLLTSDAETLTISAPTFADNINITARTNVGNGLVKIGSAGVIPPELIPPIVGGALKLEGLWDASGNTLPPDPDDGATESGQTYLVSEAGTLLLYKIDTQVQESVDVLQGDALVWLSPVNEQGVPSGWYYLGLTNLPRLAVNTLMDDSALPYVAANVQEGFESQATYMASEFASQQVDIDSRLHRVDDRASQAQAEAGTSLTEWMPPLRVHQAFNQYGLGVSVVVAAGEDLDDVNFSGHIFASSSALNKPAGFNQSMGITATSVGQEQVLELVANTAGTAAVDNRMAFRVRNGGTIGWSDWQEIWHSDNPATQAQAEAGTDNTKGMTPLRTRQSTGAWWDGISKTGSGNVVLSASPALTGVPTTPTAAIGTNTTQVASTAFVMAEVAAIPAPTNVVKNDTPRESIRDYAGTSRHAAWVSGAIQYAGGTLTQAHVQNILITAATVDVPTAAAINAQVGCLITILTTADTTVTPVAGATLVWFDGATGDAGTRNVAANSVITLCATSTSAWAIWGNGIS